MPEKGERVEERDRDLESEEEREIDGGREIWEERAPAREEI